MNYIKKLEKKLAEFDIKLYEHFLPEQAENATPAPENLAVAYFESTIESLLLHEVEYRDITDYIESYATADLLPFIREHVDFDKAVRAAEIRSDFAKALESVEHGWQLSGALGYGFSKSDIRSLAKLHKNKQNLREKIEDLLEDCNFHRECGDFCDGKYEKYLGEPDSTPAADGMERAKALISEFCRAEYGVEADFSDLTDVSIAYTTVTDEELPLQVTADLVNYKMIYTIEGDVWKTEEYKDIDDMVDHCLSDLEFDDLVSPPDEDDGFYGLRNADDKEPENNNLATPEEMKQECLARLRMFHTCNGNPERELEFEDKLNKSERMGRIPGILYWLNEEEAETVLKWETETGNKVYHVILDHTEFGPWYTFLYVDKNKEVWDAERADLAPVAEDKEAEVRAFVYTGDEGSYGYVGVRPRNGGIERTA